MWGATVRLGPFATFDEACEASEQNANVTGLVYALGHVWWERDASGAPVWFASGAVDDRV